MDRQGRQDRQDRQDHAARVRRRREQLARSAREFKKTDRYKKMRGLPMSGGEEQFTEGVYGSGKGISSNNCYAFAVDWYRDGGNEKLQPGELSKTVRPEDDATRCPDLLRLAMADLNVKKGGGYMVDPDTPCKAGYYKVMAVSAPGVDYHWYRQMGDMVVRAPGGKTVEAIADSMSLDPSQIDSPSPSPAEGEHIAVHKAGLWAHKRGHDELTVKDASGKYIVDPRTADRRYGTLNYTKFCGAMCVHKDFGKGK